MAIYILKSHFRRGHIASFKIFKEQGLAESVSARPSVREVPRSIHTSELESLFRLLSYCLFFIAYCFVCHKLYKAKKNYLNSHGESSVALNTVKRSSDGEKRG